MKHRLLKFGIGILLVSGSISCQKEVVTSVNATGFDEAKASTVAVQRAYKNNFDSWFNTIPGEGWTPEQGPLNMYYPGGGTGTATQMGSCQTYYNQYVPLGPSFASVAAPVTQFFANELAAAGFTNIPDYVSAITIDKHGNSVWFAQTSSITTPVSGTKLNFESQVNIVGGTGNFKGATGTAVIKGYLNPTDPTDAGFETNGKIKY